MPQLEEFKIEPAVKLFTFIRAKSTNELNSFLMCIFLHKFIKHFVKFALHQIFSPFSHF